MSPMNLIALVIFILIILFIISILILRKLKGSIKVQLDNHQFSPGDNLNGKVILNLRKQVTGKQLEVTLIGQRKRSNTSIISRNQTRHSSSTINMFEFSLPLDGEKGYPSGEKEYPFSIKIPRNLSQQIPNLEGVAGMLVKSMITAVNTPLRWYVVAHLNASGVDLYSKKVSINIY